MELHIDDVDRISRVLMLQAVEADDSRSYLRDLLKNTQMPTNFRMQVIGKQFADLAVDTRNLVRWAYAKGENPADPEHTVLGSLVATLLTDVGPDVAAGLVAVAVRNRLYATPAARRRLAVAYQVPSVPAGGLGTGFPVPSLELDDDETAAAAELQGLAKQPPDLLDVGVLESAIRLSSAVGRVETAGGRAIGSSVLVGSDLALTNQHVVAAAGGEAIVVRFRCTSSLDGVVVGLEAAEPVPRSSAVDELDFAALRLERPLGRAEGVEPVGLDAVPVPSKGDGLSILQHPGGGPMMLALTTNGVLGVRRGASMLRYSTRTAGGSSGSPCFDEEWRLVGIHRRELQTVWGAVREGVVIGPIVEQMTDLL